MRLVALFIIALGISACVSPTNVIKPLSDNNRGRIDVKSVEVSYSELSKSAIMAADEEVRAEGIEEGKENNEEFKPLKELMTSIVKEQLELRDADQNLSANVKIEIDNLKLAHRGMIWLTGDTDQLVGSVRVYDANTNELLTELYVDILEGHGGLLGIAIRGGRVREQLSKKFANVIGDELGFDEVEQTSSN